jgi:hypothetical protein
MNFQKLASIDVNEHIEKKAGLSYLSWAWAVDQIMRQDPEANWTFHDPQTFADGTMMVSVTVTVFKKPINMHLPVMDHRNKAIPNPDAFAINKAMMRCLVKAIACHGLGLYIYAGEDLPSNDMTLEEFTAKHLDKMQEAAANGTDALRKAYSELPTTKIAKQFWEVEGDALILWAKGVDNG